MFPLPQVCNILGGLVWRMTDIEHYVIAVDRIAEYSNTKPEVRTDKTSHQLKFRYEERYFTFTIRVDVVSFSVVSSHFDL